MEHGAEAQSPTVPPPEVRAQLRRAVHALRAGERRRVFPARVHVGRVDDAGSFEIAPDPCLDDGLRTDVVAALLRLAADDVAAGAWLTRVGQPHPHDLDAAWAPAMAAAFRERGRTPAFLAVVTKNGWYEPRGDARATWQRLRIR